MKFARLIHDGALRLGVVDPSGESVRLLDPQLTDIHQLIEEGGLVSKEGTGKEIALSDIRLLAPIVPRRNIICVGKNYSDHAREFSRSGFEAGAVTGKEIDAYPALFSKMPGSVVGPGDEIELHPDVTSMVDYEAELAVVIGRGGRGIAREDAYSHVWGYTILNDVTARDLQRNHKQWFLGKTLDTFAPMGPWVTEAGDLDPENLQVTCHVNGELRQNANTRDLIFDIPTLIATVSAGATLQAGDVIATGTPAGVGIGFDPPRFLEPGDSVTIGISGIGELTNVCR